MWIGKGFVFTSEKTVKTITGSTSMAYAPSRANLVLQTTERVVHGLSLQDFRELVASRPLPRYRTKTRDSLFERTVRDLCSQVPKFPLPALNHAGQRQGKVPRV